MPKYLVRASYNPEGLQGLVLDKASGRKAALSASVKSLKGKLETFYFSFGPQEVVMIVDLPDNVSAAAITMVANMSGAVNVETTPLLTVEEMDAAIALPTKYRAPGDEK